MKNISVQFLEDTKGISPSEAEGILERTYSTVRFINLIVGWNCSGELLEVCKEFSSKHGVRLYRWQPVLCSDGVLNPSDFSHVINFSGNVVDGFEDLPEFTFACPSDNSLMERIIEHSVDIAVENGVDGLFLDRIRFPSPFSDLRDIGCFCEHCKKKALVSGLDLEKVESLLSKMIESQNGVVNIVKAIAGRYQSTTEGELLHSFFAFRRDSITEVIKKISDRLKSMNKSVALDFFSPSLSNGVGQDYRKSSYFVEWIKAMTYAHTMGVAGLPFEFYSLFDNLTREFGMKKVDTGILISDLFGVSSDFKKISSKGFSASIIVSEIEKAEDYSSATVLSGIELVDEKNITSLSSKQIKKDLTEIRKISAAGLVLSWDLRFIPQKRIELVKDYFLPGR